MYQENKMTQAVSMLFKKDNASWNNRIHQFTVSALLNSGSLVIPLVALAPFQWWSVCGWGYQLLRILVQQHST